MKNIHVKDGFYPTDGKRLGREIPVWEGKVNFSIFIKRLVEIGFNAELIIKREIPEGDDQSHDIRKTANNLRRWISEA